MQVTFDQHIIRVNLRKFVANKTIFIEYAIALVQIQIQDEISAGQWYDQENLGIVIFIPHSAIRIPHLQIGESP